MQNRHFCVLRVLLDAAPVTGPLRLSLTDLGRGDGVGGTLLVLSLRPGAGGDESEGHREERVRCSGVSSPGLRASGSAPAAISPAEPGSGLEQQRNGPLSLASGRQAELPPLAVRIRRLIG